MSTSKYNFNHISVNAASNPFVGMNLTGDGSKESPLASSHRYPDNVTVNTSGRITSFSNSYTPSVVESNLRLQQQIGDLQAQCARIESLLQEMAGCTPGKIYLDAKEDFELLAGSAEETIVSGPYEVVEEDIQM